MTPKTIPQCFSSKDAIFKLSNGDDRSWWFVHEDEYLVVDYVPCGYPELEVGCFFDNHMTNNEGWEFISGEDKFLEAYGDAFNEKDSTELERLQHRMEER